VDGEIGADRTGSALRTLITAHLAVCPRCMRLERQVRAFRARLLAIGSWQSGSMIEQPSPEFRARMARLLAG
jgi:hypothetical protein